MSQPLCKDCIHFRTSGTHGESEQTPLCHSPRCTVTEDDLVMGGRKTLRMVYACAYHRCFDEPDGGLVATKYCGKQGWWFTPKDGSNKP